LWLPLGTAGIGILVGCQDLANRQQAMVAVSSKVIAQAAAVRTLDRLSSHCQRGKEHY